MTQPPEHPVRLPATRAVVMAFVTWFLVGVIVFLAVGFTAPIPPGQTLIAAIIVATLASAFVGNHQARSQELVSSPVRQAAAAPIAYTAAGEPIYTVIGYTADGRPITADKAVGYRPPINRTNSLAVVALVLSFFLPMFAIPLAHIAMAQIGRTGEGGRGLAVAGLVIGYIWLAALAIFCIAVSFYVLMS